VIAVPRLALARLLPRRLRELVSFLAFVVRRLLVEDRCVQVAASLTFTTLLSLVPLLTLGLIVLSAFPVFADYSARIKLFLLANLVPDFAGKIISVYMRQFADNAGRLTAVGLVLLAATALSLMLTIERTFNTIWRVNTPRPFARQMLTYWAILTLGPLLLGGGLSGLARLMRASGLGSQAPLISGLLQWLTSLLLTTLILAILYSLTPNRHVPRRHALMGAGCAALLLELTQAGFALYLDLAKSYQLVYGAFAAFPILLIWLQLIWLVVLFGAVLTATLPYWADRAWQGPANNSRRLLHVLEILLQLNEAQQQGRSLQLADLRRRVHTGYDELGHLLDTLARAGYVSRTRQDGWLLTGRAEHILLRELYQLFILPPLPFRRHSVQAQVLRGVLAPGEAALDISLAEFARRCAEPAEHHLADGH
jgi:membrane protein